MPKIVWDELGITIHPLLYFTEGKTRKIGQGNRMESIETDSSYLRT